MAVFLNFVAPFLPHDVLRHALRFLEYGVIPSISGKRPMAVPPRLAVCKEEITFPSHQIRRLYCYSSATIISLVYTKGFLCVRLQSFVRYPLPSWCFQIWTSTAWLSSSNCTNILITDDVLYLQLRAVYNAYDKFCDLPEEDRNRFRRISPCNHGYVSPGVERWDPFVFRLYNAPSPDVCSRLYCIRSLGQHITDYHRKVNTLPCHTVTWEQKRSVAGGGIGVAAVGGRVNILNKKFNVLRVTNFKSLNQMTGNPINNWLLVRDFYQGRPLWLLAPGRPKKTPPSCATASERT